MTVVKTFFALILLVFFLLPAYSVASDYEGYTDFATKSLKGKMTNGKAWIKFSPQSKICFLAGLEEGLTLLISEMDNAQGEKSNTGDALYAFERLTIMGFRMSDIMEEIDRLYEQASNRRIPVVDAYRYVLKKFKGSSAEELAAAQSALRKRYNK